MLDGRREGGGREGLQEGGCLIKQFRYGARRNMRSYPPSLNARFLCGYLSAILKKQKRAKRAGKNSTIPPEYTRDTEYHIFSKNFKVETWNPALKYKRDAISIVAILINSPIIK